MAFLSKIGHSTSTVSLNVKDGIFYVKKKNKRKHKHIKMSGTKFHTLIIKAVTIKTFGTRKCLL